LPVAGEQARASRVIRLERRLLSSVVMQTTIREPRSRARGTRPPPAIVATSAQHRTWMRSAAFWSSLVAGPVLVGTAAARIFGTRRAGLVAGGLTALGLGGFRWQLQRLFNPHPAYEVEDRIGRLEIRRMAARLEARTTIDVDDFAQGLQRGVERLLGFISGGNRAGEQIAMSSPVLAAHRLGFTTAFVMPPGRTRDSLPVPDDDRVLLSEVPSQRIAALRYAGRYDADTVARHEDEFLRMVWDAGLRPVGPVVFAGYDPPTTLPILRRNELWVELEG
jgi:hypothetical protein